MRSRRTRKKRVMGPNFNPPAHVKKQPLMRPFGISRPRSPFDSFFIPLGSADSFDSRPKTDCLPVREQSRGRESGGAFRRSFARSPPPRRAKYSSGDHVSELFCCSVGSSQPFSAGSGGARIHRRAARRVDAFGRAREASSTRASPRAARVATRDGLARGVRGVIARENRRGSPRSGVSRPHPPPSAR